MTTYNGSVRFGSIFSQNYTMNSPNCSYFRISTLKEKFKWRDKDNTSSRSGKGKSNKEKENEDLSSHVQFLLHTSGDCSLKSLGRTTNLRGTPTDLPSARILSYPI